MENFYRECHHSDLEALVESRVDYEEGGYNINKEFSSIILIRACYFNLIYMIEGMICNGADVNYEDEVIGTPLGNVWSAEALEILLENGAELNKDHRTLGISPGRIKSKEMMNILLENGLDPYLKDQNGECVFDKSDIPFEYFGDNIDVDKLNELENFLDYYANEHISGYGGNSLVYENMSYLLKLGVNHSDDILMELHEHNDLFDELAEKVSQSALSKCLEELFYGSVCDDEWYANNYDDPDVLGMARKLLELGANIDAKKYAKALSILE